ncbi:Fmu (Sun) domain-containing protein [Pyrodictium occultum]|uniref:Fmu (Sun) domain-containing protein n=1 Tax=Pyrodictium occultum TaxID=2309 RepID=A0A0V8RX64_PYROC|nr:Fmu (Sun) domain-containing protein [Pyrodictium occultum]
MEAERRGKPKLAVPAKGLRILVETVKAAEEFKPSQHAKRIVFRRHGILGTGLDRLLTSLFYDTMKRIGLLDRVAAELTGVESPLILDPWLRAALRVAADIVLFHQPDKATLNRLKWSVADFLSAKTHPYVGMYYWRLVDRLAEYRPRPRSVEEALEWLYLLPAWFIRRMRQLLGPGEAEELFKALNEKPLISVRVNTLKATVEEVVEELRREGKDPIVSERVPVVVKFKGPYDFDRSRLYREGKIVIQEEASAAASLILDPKPGMTVVDLAAAPGGKTSHMAELMRNRGRIYAFDIDEKRIERMRMILRRMGITIVKIFRMDARKAPRVLGGEVADRVLLDAPCTSTGTIAKNPELRWRIREEGLGEIVKLQREMLEAAARLVKPGGRLLYTTCSLLPEENEENIRWFLERHQEFRLVPLQGPYDPSPLLPGTMRAWPHRHGTIGFFYALLERIRSR